MLTNRSVQQCSILLLALLLLVTTGCANSKGSTAEKEDPDDTSPITLTFFGGDSSSNWNNMKDAVGQEIIKKTGVTLNAEHAVNGRGEEKFALMAASGEYPDLVYPKGDIGKLVDAGALIDLTDLIDKYGPNIKKVYGDYFNRIKYSSEDPAIYTIPTNLGVDHIAFDAQAGFEIQHQALKKLGYPKIRTVQDFEKALKDYVAKYPTTNGQPTIPLSLDAEDWKMQITVTNPAVTATGGPDDGEYYIDPKTHKAILHYKRPEEREYFRWLNHMYNEGLLDRDTFVQKSDQYKSKIAAGRVIGLIDQEWNYQDAENALKAAGKDEYTYSHFPVTLNEQYEDHSLQPIGFDTASGIGITTSCKNPVRAIKFLDFLASDEGQILRNWGIEGQHYNVENGKRVIPAAVQERKNKDNASFSRESGIGLYWIWGPHYGDSVKDPTGNYYTTNYPEMITENYSQAEKESLQAYKARTWKDLFPNEKDFPVKEWGAAYNMPVPTNTNYNVIYQKSQDIVRKRIPEAVLAKPDQFDAVYDRMLQELDQAGVPKAEEIFTGLIQNRLKLWYGKK
ncbi:extracellular solute-binding protein [Paenibacillus polymyxa]|uniref:Sugar ABC transporter periplasmic protein n=1 Tax=Paenibacillus polymyxa TaxID=1406 RepID=A0A378XY18_PAEPO|nr:ABC transporter substrate-binding protein [Paenibacillus polymyxa]MBE7898301.1 ABC transporter substrate-binding protein [Paenibacillus polymyxa]MBG9763474.1 ABC transporter substrate-binding protein [Paenibacillus polymyxa]MCC3258128.1 ABC transporter substrate-binding protein [Paenibacillus polymyxa]QPK55776.1 extracellular solute-binding protein [Paenibacillus polymyxa]QPK60866.1 extracellular solute-binding protein [Paenibacillus polymyxa]